MNIGLQTFTIRKEQRKDMEAAYLPLLEMGIRSLEVARIHFTRENAKRLAAISEKHGIIPVSIQVKPKEIFKNIDGIVDFCNITGIKNAVISMLPFKCILGGEREFYSFVSSLDGIAEVYANKGITLAYHHHNWEYVTLSSGKTRMAELLARTRKIRFVTDTYWAARSGVEPSRQIEEIGERLLGIHLRDLAHRPHLLSVIPYDTAIGKGIIDFARVLSSADAAWCEYMVIEQKTDRSYADIKTSYEHLLKLEAQLKEKTL